MRYLLILLFVTSPACGQYETFVRHELCERAVAWSGPFCRSFVDAAGNDGALACLACSPEAASKLAEFYYTGNLSKLPRPGAALRTIILYGDPALFFIITHRLELRDSDKFNAFVEAPPDYYLGRKTLVEGANELRFAGMKLPQNWRKIVLYGGIAAVIVLIAWRRKRRSVL